ncbi:MAG TPA: FtsX-like permease family protein [Stellaceae bacterium]|nr:FtsX-like permease family protein [Stellaceae bacterium]
MPAASTRLSVAPRRSVGWPVPLAWRNLAARRGRFLRSASAIGFAVLLMLVQLGFQRAFFDSALAIPRRLDGSLFIIDAAKYRFATSEPFSSHLIEAARQVPGVASASPLYAGWFDFFWQNPYDHKRFVVQALGVDPDRPVFRWPALAPLIPRLKAHGTVLVDRRARRFLGMTGSAEKSEINGKPVRIVGSFALGPDFQNDGTVIMSVDTFKELYPPAGVETGVIRLAPGAHAAVVRTALREALPRSVSVLGKPGIVRLEKNFQARVSSAGPIFTIGTAMGFAVGMLIAYQIVYTELSETLPQYATLKAIGYGTGRLVRIVLEQAFMTALAGYLIAVVSGIAIFRLVGGLALLPLQMTPQLALEGLGLTLGISLLSAMLAVRRLIAADPAEVL